VNILWKKPFEKYVQNKIADWNKNRVSLIK
jgi:hypothetical protein